MKFILVAFLAASVSAFSVTIDKTKIAEIAGSWGKTAEEFAKWSNEQDQKTVQAATPYLQELDKQLK